MPQIEKLRLLPGQGLKALSLVLLGGFSFLFILLNSILLNVESSTASSLAGPQWITTTLPSLPRLAWHKAVVVETGSGETLCVIGGNLTQTYCYPLGPAGIPESAGGGPAYSLGAALFFHAATIVGDRTYILGGMREDFLPKKEVHCVQYANGAWILKTVGVMRQEVLQHAAVTVDNRIYVIGGYDAINYLANVWSVDAGAGCATLIASDWRPEEPLKTQSGNFHQVTGHAAVSAVLDNGKKYIYVIGGLTANGKPTSIVLRAEVGSDGRLNTWDDLGAVEQMPGTWLLTAAVSGRYLYVIGGTTSSPPATPLAKVYRAQIKDSGDLEWLAPPQDFPPLHSHATAVSKSGRLYIAGGISNDALQNRIYWTPLLDFEQTGQPGGAVYYGGGISYTLKLTNLGVRDFGGLAVSDVLSSDPASPVEFNDPTGACWFNPDNTGTCYIPGLELGATTELTFQVTLSSPVSALLSDFPNARNAFSNGSGSSISSIAKPDSGPDVWITKNGQSLVAAGQMLTYTLFVYNSGPSFARDVTVTDTLPGSVTFLSATPQPSSRTPLTWSLGTIADGYSRTIQLAVRVDPGTAHNSVLRNIAQVSSDRSDAVPINNTAQKDTVVVSLSDLHISKGSVEPVMAGERLTYTLTVTNTGPSDARGAIITDTLPSNVEFISADPPKAGGSNPVFWSIDLPAQQSRVIQVVTVVSPTATDKVCNDAGISGSNDPALSDNTARTCTAITRKADLEVSKIASSDRITAGQTLTYTILITNLGPSIATQVVLTDLLPTDVSVISAFPPTDTGTSNYVTWFTPTLLKGESQEFQLQVRVNADIGVNKLQNRAHVESEVPDSNMQNNLAEVTTGIDKLADVRLGLYRDPYLVTAGLPVTYTLVATNTGPSSAINTDVSYGIPDCTQLDDSRTTPGYIVDNGHVWWNIPELGPGDRREHQVGLHLSSSCIGRLYSTAQADSDTADPDKRNNSADDSPPIFAYANLSIDKRVNQHRIVNGDRVEYTLLINNIGPSDAHDVVITDVLPAGVTFLQATLPPEIISNPLVWRTDTVAAQTVLTVNVKVLISPSARGFLLNTAGATSTVPDDDSENNYDEELISAPVIVINRATICESSLWCQDSNWAINSPFNTYLPVLLKVR